MGGYLERLKTKKRQGEVLQKLQKGENTPAHGTAKTAKSPFYSKCSKGGGHISETPPAPAQTIQERYNDLWAKAWSLADWIDDPAAAPIEDRRARLPELDRMRDRLAAMEQEGQP